MGQHSQLESMKRLEGFQVFSSLLARRVQLLIDYENNLNN